MTFNNLKGDTECNCLEDSFEDYAITYARKLNAEALQDKDFKSHWDRNIGKDKTECDEVCGFKGLSVSKIENEDAKRFVLTHYKEIFCLAPKYKGHVCIFNLLDESGVLKHTPSRKNTYHHDLYKCDEFTITKIQPIEIVKLSEYV
jgi:hypothetical protein